MINTMQKYKWHTKNKYRAICLNCSPYLVWTNLSSNLSFNKKCLSHLKETESKFNFQNTILGKYYDIKAASAAAKSLQSCPILCDPVDGSPPGSPIPGILQARTLERVAISFSNAWKWKVKMKSLSCVRLLATPGTAAHQAPPFMGFSRQEYWSGVPLPPPDIKAR